MNDSFDTGDWWDPDGFLFGLRELLNPVRVPFIVEQLRAAGSHTVLDVGCGGGFLTEALAAEGFTVAGIDASVAAIGAARSNAFSTSRYLPADAHRLPFRNRQFDAVVLSEVLEHVERAGVVFAEAVRVLAPGGVLVVTGPNRTIFSRVALIWLAQEWPSRVLPQGLHDHRAFVTPGELHGWCELLDLSPTAMVGIGIGLRDVTSAFRAVARLRRGTITYGQAGRAIRLSPSSITVIAYMAAARKP